MATGSSSKFPRVFKYYDVSTEVPQGDFKAKCRFWLENRSKFSALAEVHVAYEVLSIPSSSSPVERLFSIAGKAVALTKGGPGGAQAPPNFGKGGHSPPPNS